MPAPPISFPLHLPQSQGPTSSSTTEPPPHIPSLGLGTFQPDPNLYPAGSVKASVLKALQVGYRHIDTALAYGFGQVEREVGEAIRESGIPREEVFVVTKLHNCFHEPGDVEVGMDMSLKNLGVDYVDLYLMHFPYAYAKTADYGTQRRPDGKPVIDIPLSRAYDKTWAAMERLVDKGKARMIGVSNFSTPKLRRLLLTARIPPAVNQIELHPYFPQRKLLRFCQDHSIHVTAYGPLGCMPVAALVGRKGAGPLVDPVITSIATTYSKSPAQIILAFLLLRGVSVIPKSNSPDRIASNWDVGFDLRDEDFGKIDRVLGSEAAEGERNLQSREYLGFDNYNEEVEEP